jgi:hypothetical protein
MYISERVHGAPEVNIFEVLKREIFLAIPLLLRFIEFSLLRMNMLLQLRT